MAKKYFRKGMALFLSLTMCLSLLNLSVLAATSSSAPERTTRKVCPMRQLAFRVAQTEPVTVPIFIAVPPYPSRISLARGVSTAPGAGALPWDFRVRAS